MSLHAVWHKHIDVSLTGSANADTSVWEVMTNDMLQMFLKLPQTATKTVCRCIITLSASLDWKQFIQLM